MGNVDSELIPIDKLSDRELNIILKKHNISLKLSEARIIVKKLKRNPTLTELHIFNIEWSEHCSYKSSRETLKLLPTDGPNVIQGPKEDAGIIELGIANNKKYGVVIAHESHNHPSQIVPYEGAATGIGGIFRDVLCMGAKVVATADPLRFGNHNGRFKDRTKYIANAVVDGIAGYGNPLGIPNIAGDMYFNESFDDNCLVNVVCLGVIDESEIIHSAAPDNAVDYDIVIVGKATDISGFGGAAFASLILDDEDKEQNKGAVQVPDPFLKNVLTRATYKVFEEVRKNNIPVGFKDMGAGGIMCASSELCSSGGYGCEIDLDKVHVSMKDLPPYVIACSETQERFTWIIPKSFTKRVLEIYNEEFELPNVAEGACAKLIGRVIKDKDFIVKHDGKIVCNAPIEEVTEGIKYSRESAVPKTEFKEPILDEPKDYNEIFLKVLKHPNVASKKDIFYHYDTEVLGNAVIRSGEADAGVINPIHDTTLGIALSTDSNPRYARISPYKGAVNAVAESMRNVAAVGAVPSGMTDCLNYGNPEKPEHFWQFQQGVKGVADAAKNLYLKGHKCAVPVVSGNVSFYNESATGNSVDPSAVIACVGTMNDYSKAITMKLKEKGSELFMVGERKNELGGSVYYQLFDELGKNVPEIDFKNERNIIYAVIDSIDRSLLLSCHDISDGGFAAAISEMILGGHADGKIGAMIELKSDLRPDKLLFSESSGFIFEVSRDKIDEVKSIFEKYSVDLIRIGKTGGDNLIIKHTKHEIINISNDKIRHAWSNGLKEALE